MHFTAEKEKVSLVFRKQTINEQQLHYIALSAQTSTAGTSVAQASRAVLSCLKRSEHFSSSLRSLHQIAIMHVLSSALCDAPHCVSGTLNFITFGKIPFFAFALSCTKRKKEIRKRARKGRSCLLVVSCRLTSWSNAASVYSQKISSRKASISRLRPSLSRFGCY